MMKQRRISLGERYKFLLAANVITSIDRHCARYKGSQINRRECARRWETSVNSPKKNVIKHAPLPARGGKGEKKKERVMVDACFRSFSPLLFFDERM